MEERRKADDAFLEKFFKLQSDVQRLTEHQRLDKTWQKEVFERLSELEKLRPEMTNGRLRELEGRPIIVQVSEVRIKELIDERSEVHAGRAAIKVMWLMVATFVAGIAAAVLAWLGFKR